MPPLAALSTGQSAEEYPMDFDTMRPVAAGLADNRARFNQQMRETLVGQG